ncbi:hypothetical protein [Nocardia brevicatena]|uniref:hypothetical protein n=1 Tax=Nocardia brevicatena TaxID=37327 RepID=UPI000593B696|nr:hypothetical protein [Nocardia brevicatena]
MIGRAGYRQRIVDAQRRWDEERFAAFADRTPVGSNFRGEMESPSIPGPDDYDTLTLEQLVAAVEQMDPAALHAAGRVWRDIGTELLEGAHAFDERFREPVEGMAGRAGWTGSAAQAAVDGIRRCTEAVAELALAAHLIALGLEDMATGLGLTRALVPALCARPDPRDSALPTEGILKEGDYLLEEAEDEARRILRTVYAPAAHRADLGVPVLPGPPMVVDQASFEAPPGSDGSDTGGQSVARRPNGEGSWPDGGWPRSGDEGPWPGGREQGRPGESGHGQDGRESGYEPGRPERSDPEKGDDLGQDRGVDDETSGAATDTTAPEAVDAPSPVEGGKPAAGFPPGGSSTVPAHSLADSAGSLARSSPPPPFVAPDLPGIRDDSDMPSGPNASGRAGGATDSAASSAPGIPGRRNPGSPIASVSPQPGRGIADTPPRSAGTAGVSPAGAAGTPPSRAAVVGLPWSAVPTTARGTDEERESRSVVKEYLVTEENGAELIGSNSGAVTVQPVWAKE